MQRTPPNLHVLTRHSLFCACVLSKPAGPTKSGVPPGSPNELAGRSCLTNGASSDLLGAGRGVRHPAVREGPLGPRGPFADVLSAPLSSCEVLRKPGRVRCFKTQRGLGTQIPGSWGKRRGGGGAGGAGAGPGGTTCPAGNGRGTQAPGPGKGRAEGSECQVLLGAGPGAGTPGPWKSSRGSRLDVESEGGGASGRGSGVLGLGSPCVLNAWPSREQVAGPGSPSGGN